MTNRVFLVLTVFTVLLTGLLAVYAGWFSGSRGSRHPDLRSQAKARDLVTTEAAWRYRRYQPVHWRALFLHH
jgi:hypothetical protein